MSKIIYFLILLTLPFIAASVAYAQPRKQDRAPIRQAVICGYVMKAETFFVKSTPVTYVIADNGRAYTLFPELGNGTQRDAATRMQLILSLRYLQPVCLDGLAYEDFFMPNAVVVRTARKNGQPQQQPTAPRRNTAWIPWNRSSDAAP